jgi:CysZ protein
MGSFAKGVSDYLGAGRIILENHLWRWLVLPGLISLLYFPLIIWFCVVFMDDTAAYLRDQWLPTWLQYPLVVWVLAAAVWLGVLYYGFTFYRNVIMIVFSPVLGIVSERTEKSLTNKDPANNSQATVWRGMKRGIKMSLASLALSLLAFAGCWALLLIPVVGGLLLAVCLPASQMFFAGQGFIDPTLERKSYGVRDSLKFCWEKRMRTIGVGAGFTLLTLVPIVGWFVAPGFGIVAGTRSAVDLLKRQR